MKKIYLLFAGITMFFLQVAFSFGNNPTVKEQLENLNEFWKEKKFNDLIFQDRIPLIGDVALIQMHLSLVEQKLREKNTDNLLATQRQNRNKCLDILHNYWEKGIFPKNIYHKKRTPYFIDDFGTACAVGQLIISTGFEKLAKKISAEKNYSYIKELDLIYPQLKQWANEYGFELDELAWIQPCYDPCSMPPVGTLKNVSCFGGYDGAFVPNPYSYPFPYAFGPCYKWQNEQWTLPSNQCGGPGCDLNEGIYKFVVTDGVGTVHEYIDTITQPDSIYAVKNSTDDDGTCNGSASLATSGGISPYTFLWSNGQTSSTITSLCQGNYKVTITDVNNCNKIDSVKVNFPAGINEMQNSFFRIFPNPANNKLFIQTDGFFVSDDFTLSIYNTLGEIILTEKSNSNKTDINIAVLNNGIYFISISSGAKTVRKKFLINKI